MKREVSADSISIPPGSREAARGAEALERLTRLETRVTAFMIWNGFDPYRNLSKKNGEYTEPHVVDGDIYAATPHTTLGDVMMTALKHKLTGDVDVYVAGRRMLVINVEDV